ncbi:hypothetical protein HPB50_017557 [Hyalomma asiaticum]|uniref:Uncharacterized protein n=1 Tax=Hyalomma asiaticum TaxID=266040 RepID=A0ACB7SNK9_HYAAI|nr:hypothetical protein HPB50_017557 [Hyalomma asiaticum]
MFTLIRIWQDHIGNLRRTKRNSRVYTAIAEALQAEGIEKPLKAVEVQIGYHTVSGTPPPPQPPVSGDGAGDLPSLPASPFTADMERVTPRPGVDLNSSEETSGKATVRGYKLPSRDDLREKFLPGKVSALKKISSLAGAEGLAVDHETLDFLVPVCVGFTGGTHYDNVLLYIQTHGVVFPVLPRYASSLVDTRGYSGRP